MPCSSEVISEMLPEIHTTEQCYFLKSIINSQIIQFSVVYVSKYFEYVNVSMVISSDFEYWNFGNLLIYSLISCILIDSSTIKC